MLVVLQTLLQVFTDVTRYKVSAPFSTLSYMFACFAVSEQLSGT